MEPERLLDRSTGSLRKWLATPLESMFATAEDLRRLPPPPRPAGSARPSAQGAILVTQAFATCEVSAESRPILINALHQPEYLVQSIRQASRTIGPMMLPVMFIIPAPLTLAEGEQLRRQQTERIAYFDRCIARTHSVLLQLTEEGANPLWILSILVRYASRTGTAFPSSRAAVLPRSRFAFETPLSWTKRGDGMEPVRLTGLEASSPQPPRPRRGPAGIGVNVGMALLAHHLHVATKRHGPHATEIAALFEAWGPDLSHLNREIVYRRLKRLETSHAGELRRLVREEAQQRNAEQAFFERFAEP